MAGMLRKGMSWLGLGPDEDFDEYDDGYDYEEFEDDADVVVDLTVAAAEPAPVVRAVPPPQARVKPARVEPAVSASASYTSGYQGGESASVRVLPSAGVARPRTGEAPEPVRPRGVVRPIAAPETGRPHVVAPATFNDAQEVGDKFRKRQPVVVNLQGLDRDLARRLLDFSSGVAYGLGGHVERVASHVYLLTPADVEISSEDLRRLRERGLIDD